MESIKKFSFKIVIIGPKSSGKTYLIRRYLQNFSIESPSTNLYDLRFEYGNFPTDVIKEEKLDRNSVQIVEISRLFDQPIPCMVSLSLWDCPSIEDIDLRNLYYQDVDSVIVIGDITSELILDNSSHYKEDFSNIATVSRHHYFHQKTVVCDHPSYEPAATDIPIFLFLNKYDLLSSDESGKIKSLCQNAEENHKFTACGAISCKVDDGSAFQAFNSVVRLLIDREVEKEISKSVGLNISEMKSMSENFQGSTQLTSADFVGMGDKEIDSRLSALSESSLLVADWFVKLSQKMQRLWLLWQYYSQQRLKSTDPIVTPIGRLLYQCRGEFEGLLVGELDFPDDFREEHSSIDVSQKMIGILCNRDLKTVISTSEEQEFWDRFESDLARLGGLDLNCDYSKFGSRKVLAVLINYYNLQVAPACFVIQQYIPVILSIIQFLQRNIPQKVLQKRSNKLQIACQNLFKIREVEYKLKDLKCLCQNINDPKYLQAHAIDVDDP